jgi:hypothetical protein
MDPGGSRWISVEPGGCRSSPMDPGRARWISVDPGRSRSSPMDPGRARWILMDPGRARWILMDPGRARWILMDPGRVRWILMDPGRVRWIPGSDEIYRDLLFSLPNIKIVTEIIHKSKDENFYSVKASVFFFLMIFLII